MPPATTHAQNARRGRRLDPVTVPLPSVIARLGGDANATNRLATARAHEPQQAGFESVLFFHIHEHARAGHRD